MNTDNNFTPSVDWMAKKYMEMNEMLFNGELGGCDFNIFTKGKGSEGGTLGWFRISGNGVKVNRYSRRMFKENYYTSDKVIINRDNFYEMCKPIIELNGNYRGAENSFLATLVHEMCHYYTYMDGFAPKQGHGPEFKYIGNIVTSRSNGLFTIQRLASAEQMSNLELNDEMKAKKEKRKANKISHAIALLIYKTNGDIRLVLTRKEQVVDGICELESTRSDTVKISRSSDATFIEYLISKGYSKLFRTYRFWNIKDNSELLAMADKFEWKDIYENPQLSGQKLSVKRPTKQSTQPKRIFSIKTTNGTFEFDGTVYAPLFRALKTRFPKMSDETINKIINNPANYKMMENKRTTKDIIKEVIEELISNEFKGAENDSIEITPNMNLGKYSPLEMQLEQYKVKKNISESLNNEDSPLFHYTDLNSLAKIINSNMMKSPDTGICFTRNKHSQVGYSSLCSRDGVCARIMIYPQSLQNIRNAKLMPYNYYYKEDYTDVNGQRGKKYYDENGVKRLMAGTPKQAATLNPKNNMYNENETRFFGIIDNFARRVHSIDILIESQNPNERQQYISFLSQMNNNCSSKTHIFFDRTAFDSLNYTKSQLLSNWQ